MRKTCIQRAVWRERRCSPQKPLRNFAGFAPARASVSRLPRQAATTLGVSVADKGVKTEKMTDISNIVNFV